VKIGRQVPTFRRTLLWPSSEHRKDYLFYLEYGGNRFFQTAGVYLPNYTEPHSITQIITILHFRTKHWLVFLTSPMSLRRIFVWPNSPLRGTDVPTDIYNTLIWAGYLLSVMSLIISLTWRLIFMSPFLFRHSKYRSENLVPNASSSARLTNYTFHYLQPYQI
jgi:hypothetical protein